MRFANFLNVKIFYELSRAMAFTTRNTVNRLARKELHLKPVVQEGQRRNKPMHQAPET